MSNIPKPIYDCAITYRTPSGKRVRFGALVAADCLSDCEAELIGRLRNAERFGRRKIASIVGEFSAIFATMQIGKVQPETGLPKGYIRIAGDWSYAPLRVGLVVRAPDGKEVYCQPGDDETAIRANIEALDEIDDEKRATICAMVFGEYF